MRKEGVEKLVAFPGLSVEDHAAGAEKSGAGDGGKVSIPQRVEALFGAVMFLVTFIVD